MEKPAAGRADRPRARRSISKWRLMIGREPAGANLSSGEAVDVVVRLATRRGALASHPVSHHGVHRPQHMRVLRQS